MELLSKSLKPNAFSFECVLTKPLNISTFLSVRKDCINKHNPLDSFICVFHKFCICLVCMHKVPRKWKQILDITTKVWIPVMTNLRTGLLYHSDPLQGSITLLNLVWSLHNLIGFLKVRKFQKSLLCLGKKSIIAF